MTEGDFKVIQWKNVDNPNDNRISVTVWQLNGTQFIGDSEYVIQNAAPDTLSASWTVNTNKNLTVSPMFYFNLFFEGETGSLTNSHYFNISAKSATTTSSSTSSAISSTTTSATSTHSPTSSSVTTPTPSQPPTPASSGLSTGAKVGIAVGVIGATLVGVLTGWLFLGRKRRMDKTETATSVAAHPPPVQTTPYERIKAEQQHPYEVHGEALPVMSYELAPQTGHNT
ncbi:MAG: hypothetical protein Q9160_008231 [Pyrenula sp. 1 TL-2023]